MQFQDEDDWPDQTHKFKFLYLREPLPEGWVDASPRRCLSADREWLLLARRHPWRMGFQDVECLEWVSRTDPNGGHNYLNMPAGTQVLRVEAGASDRFRMSLQFTPSLRESLGLPESGADLEVSLEDLTRARLADWKRPEVGLAVLLKAAAVHSGSVEALVEPVEEKERARAAAIANRLACAPRIQLPEDLRRRFHQAVSDSGLEQHVDLLESFARPTLAFVCSNEPSPHLYANLSGEMEGLILQLELSEGTLQLFVDNVEDLEHRLLVTERGTPASALPEGTPLEARDAVSLPNWYSPEFDAFKELGVDEERYVELWESLRPSGLLVEWGAWPQGDDDLILEAHRSRYGAAPTDSERANWWALVAQSADKLFWGDAGTLNVLVHDGDPRHSTAFICFA